MVSAATQVRAMTEAVKGAAKAAPTLPEKGALAKAWENEACLRQRILCDSHPHLTRWKDQQSIGIASTAAMALNARVLEVLAKVWAPLQAFPKPVPVGYLRREARSEMFFARVAALTMHRVL